MRFIFFFFFLNESVSSPDLKKHVLARLGKEQKDLKMFEMSRDSVSTKLSELGTPIPPKEIIKRAHSAEGNVYIFAFFSLLYPTLMVIE